LEVLKEWYALYGEEILADEYRLIARKNHLKGKINRIRDDRAIALEKMRMNEVYFLSKKLNKYRDEIDEINIKLKHIKRVKMSL